MRNKLMMAWKAWVESMGQAMANPNAVREKETRKTVNTTSRNPIKVISDLNEKQVDDGMEGLGGIHGPGDGESQRSEGKRDKENCEHNEQESNKGDVRSE